jgi:AIPR protein
MNNLPFFFNHHLKRLAKQFFPNEMTDGEPQSAAIDKAFEIFTIGIILEKSFDEVKRNIWIEGKEDGGIDGVYIDHQTRKLLAFQCKNKANLSANDIEKFRDNFRQVFQEGKAKAHSTDLINKLKQLRYEDILESEVYDFKMCFVFNGETSSDNNYHIIRQIDDARLSFFDLTKLHQGIADLMMTEEKRRPVKFIFRPENSNTELSDAQALISFAINSIKAVNFRISAKHLCELVEEEQRTNGSIGELFSGNIRGYLGRDNFTNKKMIETLQSNDRYFFPFLNNGVTMICSRFRLPANKQLGNYLIESENPVIVNGLQTTNILYEQYKTAPESLHNVFVLIRLYETDQQDLIDLITDATNTQSAIDFRDKLSNKPFMKNLKAFFAENGVDLVTKRGDTFRSFIKNDTIRPSVESDVALENWYDIFSGKHYNIFFQ